MRYLNIKTVPIFFLLGCIVSFSFLILTIHPFLSRDSRIEADALVFERWIYDNDNSVQEAINEFFKGDYKVLVIVGFFPESPIDSSFENSNTDSAKQAFIEKGFNEYLIQSIWVPNVQKNRTFSMALVFKIWAAKSGLDIRSINVFTYGVHARKSELIFKQVLEPEIHVGVISSKPTQYNPKYWWLSQIGWKWVFFDTLKYIHASIF